MGDRTFFMLMTLIALAMIGLAMVWPQGIGKPSPAPFGHAPSTHRRTLATPGGA